MTTRITTMSLKDIPAILEIERDSHLEPWTGEAFAEELNRLHSRVLIARVPAGSSREVEAEDRSEESADVIAGYICFWRVADEIQILNIAVRPSFRRRGIARSLLLQTLKSGFAAGAEKAVLEARESNEAARALYESFGFFVVGERPNYYGVVKEPAVLMELNLRKWFSLESAAGHDAGV